MFILLAIYIIGYLGTVICKHLYVCVQYEVLYNYDNFTIVGYYVSSTLPSIKEIYYFH